MVRIRFTEGRDNSRPRRRRQSFELQADRLIHLAGTLYTLAGQGRRHHSARGAGSRPMRRRRQRLNLVRGLLQTLPPPLQPESPFEELFWTVLRWGGAGLLLGRLLGT